jgi:hypothetical protein
LQAKGTFIMQTIKAGGITVRDVTSDPAATAKTVLHGQRSQVTQVTVHEHPAG